MGPSLLPKCCRWAPVRKPGRQRTERWPRNAAKDVDVPKCAPRTTISLQDTPTRQVTARPLLTRPVFLEKQLRVRQVVLDSHRAVHEIKKRQGNPDDGNAGQPEQQPVPHELVANDLRHGSVIISNMSH